MRRHRRQGTRRELISQFDEWAAAYWPRLYACAEKNADEWTDVELLLTDTLRTVARVFSQRPMGEELLFRYAMRCLRNAARQTHRRNRVSRHAESCFGEAQQQHWERMETLHCANSLHATLLELLQQIPDESAALLKMKQWERLTFADIAGRIGVPESTVRRRYEAALALLRNKLKNTDHE